MGRELTIFIVEDSALIRDRLVEVIAEVPNSRVVGEAADSGRALEGVRASRPRVLIVDVQLRQGSGLLLLKQIRAEQRYRPELVIIITNNPTEAYRDASQECGADHFFDKASEFDRVRDVLLQYCNAA